MPKAEHRKENQNIIANLPLNDFASLYKIVEILRGPGGCPWDQKQTPESLRPDLLEECCECVDAIDSGSAEHVKEELGDVFLVTAMILRIFEEEGSFTLPDVFEEICRKLIRRHPHVFGEEEITTSDGVIRRWDEIKQTVEGRGAAEGSRLSGIPGGLPPLERACRLQKKAAKAGFDWNRVDDIFDKLREEIDELEDSIRRSESPERREEEMGDALFSLVNVSRFLKIDPAIALNRTNRKFVRRFGYVEEKMKEQGLDFVPENFSQMDSFWDEAKTVK